MSEPNMHATQYYRQMTLLKMVGVWCVTYVAQEKTPNSFNPPTYPKNHHPDLKSKSIQLQDPESEWQHRPQFHFQINLHLTPKLPLHHPAILFILPSPSLNHLISLDIFYWPCKLRRDLIRMYEDTRFGFEESVYIF